MYCIYIYKNVYVYINLLKDKTFQIQILLMSLLRVKCTSAG